MASVVRQHAARRRRRPGARPATTVPRRRPSPPVLQGGGQQQRRVRRAGLPTVGGQVVDQLAVGRHRAAGDRAWTARACRPVTTRWSTSSAASPALFSARSSASRRARRSASRRTLLPELASGARREPPAIDELLGHRGRAERTRRAAARRLVPTSSGRRAIAARGLVAARPAGRRGSRRRRPATVPELTARPAAHRSPERCAPPTSSPATSLSAAARRPRRSRSSCRRRPAATVANHSAAGVRGRRPAGPAGRPRPPSVVVSSS